MFLDDLKYFYISFNNEDLKNILLSFLIFGKNEKITKFDYIKNLVSFINIDDKFNLLVDKSSISYFSFFPDTKYWFHYKINKKEEYIVVKSLFLEFLNHNKINFSFCSRIKKFFRII